ncbi:DinB family protein [Streptomyces sp. NPDC047108]|uniref:DinB family protein n=1 Tax=Streptomyces sp. NPDC047108 TaxID=3155025 RepID=UPI0033F48E0C
MTITDRPSPPTASGERAMLEGWLEFHRATLVAKCEGLDDAKLREASVPPSSLSLMGLVRHMADVERHWFRRTLTAEDAPPLFYTDEDPDGEFHLSEKDTWKDARAAWEGEVGRARDAASGRSLDDLAVQEIRGGEKVNLRWIYVHMIEEYARHNGHADLIRERVDGAVGA